MTSLFRYNAYFVETRSGISFVYEALGHFENDLYLLVRLYEDYIILTVQLYFSLIE